MCPDQSKKYDSPHPRGSVLAFTLVIMLLMALAGMAIMVNTRNELIIAGSVASGRNAFSATDAAAQISTLMGRILLYPELNTPDNILKTPGSKPPAYPLSVAINQDKFKMPALLKEGEDYDYTKRYIQAGSEQGRVENSENLSPHLTFTIPGKDSSGKSVEVTVASASFSLEKVLPNTGAGYGGSIGQGSYDKTGGDLKIQMFMTVTVNGRPMTVDAVDSSANSFDGGTNEGPYSIITTIFREII